MNFKKKSQLFIACSYIRLSNLNFIERINHILLLKHYFAAKISALSTLLARDAAPLAHPTPTSLATPLVSVIIQRTSEALF
jgi:hypothetical protein